ncbi:hypothetical protein JCM33374_g177 [Metschnikowia sp. JCM 33374]|nr:hypothetical protein JCM33374_g177 [Metschnikowia sp. JCM 33374]
MRRASLAKKDAINGKENYTMIKLNGILSTDSEEELETETDSDRNQDIYDFLSEAGSLIPRDRQVPKDYTNPCEKKVTRNHSSHTENSFYDAHCAKYMSFTDDNPTTYHATSYFSELLENSGFKYMPESEKFNDMEKGGIYFTKRGGQSLVAFIIGGRWDPENGIAAIGCHVDALTIKLKPCSIKENVEGYDLLGVAPYSGALNHLWLDRDLGIAGTVLIRDTSSGKIETKLISSGRHAICRIPSLAPHFGSISNIPYNKETKMVPVMGFGTSELSASEDEKSSPMYGKHSLSLLRYIAKLAEVKLSQILQVDLDLYDVQQAARGGLSNEFIFAPRIDDRLCAYSAIHGLINHSRINDLSEYDGLSIVLLANNEEIGSATRTGAKGKLLNSVVERVLISKGFNYADLPLVFANSIILSADVTHALNPNFREAYLKGHFPVPNKGLVLKLDANGHVMTDSIGNIIMNEIAKKNGLTLQQFHIRNDMPSGGTIGPMLAVDTGARVIDVGLAQLSMHSIRASAGFKEPGIGILTFGAFFRCWRATLLEIDFN